MYMTKDFEAETLPLLQKEYVNYLDDYIHDVDIFYQHPNGVEYRLSGKQEIRFVDDVNDAIKCSDQENKYQRQHEGEA